MICIKVVIYTGLGDNKAWIRSASISSINAFGEQGGYKEFFEGEMVFDALKGGSPTLRSELWNWLADKLPKSIRSQHEKHTLFNVFFFSKICTKRRINNLYSIFVYKFGR